MKHRVLPPLEFAPARVTLPSGGTLLQGRKHNPSPSVLTQHRHQRMKDAT